MLQKGRERTKNTSTLISGRILLGWRYSGRKRGRGSSDERDDASCIGSRCCRLLLIPIRVPVVALESPATVLVVVVVAVTVSIPPIPPVLVVEPAVLIVVPSVLVVSPVLVVTTTATTSPEPASPVVVAPVAVVVDVGDTECLLIHLPLHPAVHSIRVPLCPFDGLATNAVEE